jgi:hypothetical protein
MSSSPSTATTTPATAPGCRSRPWPSACSPGYATSGWKATLAKAEPKMLRYRIFSAPARLVTHARKKILKIPPGWTWSTDLATAWQRIHALQLA